MVLGTKAYQTISLSIAWGVFEVLFFWGCSIEEAMVARFPYIIPEEFANKPLLKREVGRGGGGGIAEMKVKVKGFRV